MDDLRKYAAFGFTSTQLAQILGREYDAVCVAIRKYQVPVVDGCVVRRHPPELIPELRERGLSYRAIGELLGVSTSGVWSHCVRIGLVPLRAEPGEVEKIKELRDQGIGVRDIARITRRSNCFVCAALRV